MGSLFRLSAFAPISDVHLRFLQVFSWLPGSSLLSSGDWCPVGLDPLGSSVACMQKGFWELPRCGNGKESCCERPCAGLRVDASLQFLRVSGGGRACWTAWQAQGECGLALFSSLEMP